MVLPLGIIPVAWLGAHHEVQCGGGARPGDQVCRPRQRLEGCCARPGGGGGSCVAGLAGARRPGELRGGVAGRGGLPCLRSFFTGMAPTPTRYVSSTASSSRLPALPQGHEPLNRVSPSRNQLLRQPQDRRLGNCCFCWH